MIFSANIAWFGAGRERFVKAFAPQPCVFGQLCHATCAGDISNCDQKQIRIRIFQCCGKIFRDGFLISQIIGCVKGGKFRYGNLSYFTVRAIEIARLMSRFWPDLSPPSKSR